MSEIKSEHPWPVGWVLADATVLAKIVAPSPLTALSLWLRAVNDMNVTEVRVWRVGGWSLCGSLLQASACDVFRLQSERISPERWPLAQARTDKRGWNEWHFIRRERLTVMEAERTRSWVT